MNLTTAQARVEHASDLPGLLDAAYDAFEAMLAVIRQWEEEAGGAFAAFVFSGAAAANGRDWIADAPSLRASLLVPAGNGVTGEWPAPGDLPAETSVAGAAKALAGLGALLARKLMASATSGATGNLADRESCAQAAMHAARIHSLLAEPHGP